MEQVLQLQGTYPEEILTSKAERTDAHTNQEDQRGLEDGSSENYLGGDPWTRLVGCVWVPWILQSGQTTKSHNAF